MSENVFGKRRKICSKNVFGADAKICGLLCRRNLPANQEDDIVLTLYRYHLPAELYSIQNSNTFPFQNGVGKCKMRGKIFSFNNLVQQPGCRVSLIHDILINCGQHRACI